MGRVDTSELIGNVQVINELVNGLLRDVYGWDERHYTEEGWEGLTIEYTHTQAVLQAVQVFAGMVTDKLIKLTEDKDQLSKEVKHDEDK